MDSIVQGMPADVLAPKARALETERLAVEEQLAAANDKGKAVAIHPAAIKNYLEDIAAMQCLSVSWPDRGSGSDVVTGCGTRRQTSASFEPPSERSHVQILAEDASCGNHCGKYPLVGSTKARGNKHQRNSPAATTNILCL